MNRVCGCDVGMCVVCVGVCDVYVMWVCVCDVCVYVVCVYVGWPTSPLTTCRWLGLGYQLTQVKQMLRS